MKIFLDTASLKEIREAAALGVVDGVTTNPSLLAKESGEPEEILLEICRTVDGPISAEVVATDAEGMVREGRHWAALHKNIVVKCPCTAGGLKATKTLSTEGHRVNMTLVFSPTQALLAAKAGASFVSPFVGRLDDIATPGMELVADIVQISDNYRSAARSWPPPAPSHPRGGGGQGGGPHRHHAHERLPSLLKHPLTDIGLKRFLEDWEKAKKELGAKAPR